MLDFVKRVWCSWRQTKAIELDPLFVAYEKQTSLVPDTKDIHLVLGGSGLRLYGFLLAIYVLHLLGYRFTKISGVSGGALVGAFLAQKYDPMGSPEQRGKAIRRMIRRALTIDILALLDPQLYIWKTATGRHGFVKGNRILKRLKKELPKSFSELKVPLEIVVFQINLKEPRTRILTEGPLPEAVRASFSIPFLFDPVPIGDALYVDGGWQMNLPLPEGGQGVVALCFSAADDLELSPVQNNVELGFRLMEGAIASGVRRAIKAAPAASIVELSSSIGGMDFLMTTEDKVRGMREGADSVLFQLPKT